MNNLKRIEYSLKKRKRQESRFKIYGLLGITTAVTFLCIILSSIFMEGKKAFLSTYIKLEVYFDPDIIYTDNDQKEEDIKFANFQKIIKNSLNSFFPEISDKGELRKLNDFISSSEEENLMRLVLENKQLIGQKVTLWLLASSKIDVINKNPDMELIAEEDRLISNLELNWLNEIRSANNIESNFNKNFFLHIVKIFS